MSGPVIDGARLVARLEALAAIGATERGGVTREAYGDLDVQARDLVARWMAEAGLEARVDPAANLIGRRAGTAGAIGLLSTGSHLDTVVEAGPLDGAYGVVAGVEMADALRRSGHPLRHGLAVVAFANEEGARGTNGMVGSRALLGAVDGDELASVDDVGVALADRLAGAGGDPTRLADGVWDPTTIAAFVELHVEQGPVLDAASLDLGVVTDISGRLAVDFDIVGAANHAGTTPMGLRRDAAAAAAEVMLTIEAMGRDGAVRVATCGHLQVGPNVRNVVPGRARLSAELRDEDPDALLDAQATLEVAVAEVARRRDIKINVTWGQYVPPVAADPTVVAVIRGRAERSGRTWRDLPSGAGHDAQILGGAVPIGMIFVPSIGGVSHSPDERTAAEHLVLGAQLLLEALIDLDVVLGAGAAGPDLATDGSDA